MSDILVWLVTLTLILSVLKLCLTFLPRWLFWLVVIGAIWQLLHPQARQQVVDAVRDSAALEPSLTLGLMLLGLGLLFKGLSGGKKR